MNKEVYKLTSDLKWLEQQPTMEKPIETGYNWNEMSDWERHIASMTKYPAAGFTSEQIGKELVEGKDFEIWNTYSEHDNGYKQSAIPLHRDKEADVSTSLSFQQRVDRWVLSCFGEKIAKDVIERNHRFLEEALELVQSTGITSSECHQLVDYVFNRPTGETVQEVGGVIVTLCALCSAIGIDLNKAGEKELERIWGKVGAIRIKQAAKPKNSPLPQTVTHKEDEREQGEDNTPFNLVRSALQELVYLKSIKGIEEFEDEYERRKPLAWAKAKIALSKTIGHQTTKNHEQDKGRS